MSAAAYRAQRGMSLVEILVAVTISLILLGGVLQIFLNSKQTYTLQDAMARVQENGRFAIDLLTRELRMTGYMGCNANTANVNLNVIATNGEANLFTAATSLDGRILPAGGSEIEGTDEIAIRRASENAVNLFEDKADNANAKIDGNPANFAAGDILMISDCEHADIFAATTVSAAAGKTTIAHASGNTTNRLGYAYGPEAEMMSFQSTRYFLRNTTRQTTSGLPVPALYRTNLINDRTEEVIEGVEYMRVLYGVDSNGDRLADDYLTATEVGTDWADVISARLALLVASTDEVLPAKTRKYTILGDPITTTDGRARRVFTSTVTLRNRAP